MQGLRKRRTAEEAAPDEPSSSAVVETLKALDVYPKTLDDFKERTGWASIQYYGSDQRTHAGRNLLRKKFQKVKPARFSAPSLRRKLC